MKKLLQFLLLVFLFSCEAPLSRVHPHLADELKSGGSFEGRDLRGRRCVACSGEGRNFRKAQMAGFISSDGVWSGADFRGADLRGAQFYRDDLRDVDFREADLRGAVLLPGSLEGSRFNAKTRLPFSEEVARKLGMRNDDATP